MSEIQDVAVRVETRYLEEQSDPTRDRFVFAYHVAIINRGTEPAQLLTRHWIIEDAEGRIEEVEGDGVVGQQPVIEPGRSYEYTSGCVLKTDCGSMRGSYGMESASGERFAASIPAFTLRKPGVLH